MAPLAHASSARDPFQMPPLIALGLLAVAGLLAMRLPWFRGLASGPERELWSGLAAIGCGLVLGPGIGAIDHVTLVRLEPLGALAAAWIGASVGAASDPRWVRRLPSRARTTVSIEALSTIGLVGLAAWVLTRRVSALGALWVPPPDAIAALACVALVSDASMAPRPPDGRTHPDWGPRRLARLETAVGTLALVCAAALFHPHPPWVGRGAARDLLLSAAAPAAIALFALRRQVPRVPAPAALGLALLAGGALGAAAGFSPFAVGAIGAAAWVRLAKGGASEQRSDAGTGR